MTIKEMIWKKLTSAQFLITLSVVGTYCLVMISYVYLVVKGKLSIEAFLALFAAFSTLAANIVNSYFKRDRTPPENKEVK